MVTSSSNFNATNWNNQPSVQTQPLSYSGHNNLLLWCNADGSITLKEGTGSAATAANQWTEAFFDLMAQGYSVGEACTVLKKDPAYASAGMDSVVICGDENTVIQRL